MVRTIEAVFDGMVLRPTEPLALAANTRVRVIAASDEFHEQAFNHDLPTHHPLPASHHPLIHQSQHATPHDPPH